MRAADGFRVGTLAVQELRAAADDPNPCVPTGLIDLDSAVDGGLPPSSVTVLFGRAGERASALATTLAGNAAHAGVPTLVMSWECPVPEVARRLHAASVRAPLTVNAGASSVRDLRETVVAWRGTHTGLGLLVLHGLPRLIRRADHGPDGSWDEHARLSAQIKSLAHETGATVVLTAPITRAAARGWARDALPDVAYSPAYVSDADVVIALPDHGPGDYLLVLKSKLTAPDAFLVQRDQFTGRFVDAPANHPEVRPRRAVQGTIVRAARPRAHPGPSDSAGPPRRSWA